MTWLFKVLFRSLTSRNEKSITTSLSHRDFGGASRLDLLVEEFTRHLLCDTIFFYRRNIFTYFYKHVDVREAINDKGCFTKKKCDSVKL